ncbi:unnamed protein product, partial [marine sediment metagenome]
NSPLAGMGADLFESYVGSIISSMILGGLLFEGIKGIMFPLLLAACGAISAIIGTFFVQTKSEKDLHNALTKGTLVSGFLVLICSAFLSNTLFGNLYVFYATTAGLIAGILIGLITEYYTSYHYSPVKSISKSSLTGAATTIITGLAVGMISTTIPLIIISVTVLIAYKFAGLYGIAISAVGMQEISKMIEEGAMTFLKREYSVLVFFVILVSSILTIVRGHITGITFIVGAVCSGLAGFTGMKIATKANTRTTFAAVEGGVRKALRVAFSGGAVMGMSVAGFGLLGLGGLYYLIRDPEIINGFALGASSIALFARVGGGIFTKAADVGADLVGKVEAGIPEDDPRNPAVIADNVGDNVGDI